MPEMRTGELAAERTLLARHADVLVTMDDARREIPDGGLFVRGNRIEQVGATADLPPSADEVLDLSGHVLLPGLVNTHHHMFQTLTRVVPAAEDAELFGWLQALYPIWARLTPAECAEALGWTRSDVWHAHCVQLDAPGIALFARTGTGVAHCPCSNMRLGSGIAPVRRMRDAGVAVGLGVDGSASNDGSQMLAEARQALLLARLSGDPAALSARDALEMATRGGARVLGRDDVGHLAPGMAADFVAFAVDDLRHAGATQDPVASLVFCGAGDVGTAVIDGRVVVRGGQLTTLDLGAHLETHLRTARRLFV